MYSNRILSTMTLCLLGLAIGCGKEKGDSGKVNVAMSNSTATSLLLQSGNEAINITPSYFGLKIVSAALRFDDDKSTPSVYGLESGIYAAPTGCTNGGVDTIEYDDKEYEVLTPPGPNACDGDLMPFIDFAQGSAAVNAELNAAQSPVIPGTYNEVYVCFISMWGLRVDGHVDTVTTIDARSQANHGEGGYGCSLASLDNLEIGEGETVTVTLDYNLGDGSIVQVNNEVPYSSGSNCVKSSTDSNVNFCVNGLNPTVSASK